VANKFHLVIELKLSEKGFSIFKESNIFEQQPNLRVKEYG
jgi:hypothetical protein